MAVDKRIEVEIALRDSASLTLKAIADQLDHINKAMAKGGGEGKAITDGAETFKKIKETTEGIRKTSEDGGKTVVEAAEGMKLLSASLLRSAAGRILLGEEIIRFGANFVNDAMRERQQWNLLAQDTGLSEGFLSMLTQAQLKAAIDPEQARANIKNLSEGLRPMGYGHGSPMAQRLSAIGHEVYSRSLTELMMEGKKEEAIRSIIAKGEEEFKKGDIEGRRFAEAVGVNPAFFKDMTHLLTTVQPAFQIALETANNWGLGWTYMVGWWTKNVTDAAKSLGISLISPRTNPYTYWLAMNADYGPLTPYLLPDEKLQAWKERSKEELNILGDILTTLQNHQNKKSLEKREAGGTVLAGREYLVAEKGPEIFRSNAGWMQMLEPPGANRGRLRGGRFQAPTGGDILPNLEGEGSGGGFPDMRGVAPPGSEGDLSTRPGTEGSLSHLFDDLEARARFNQRWGDWGYKFTPRGWEEHPRAGKTPEETWEALNKGLSSDWGWGVGIPEGRTPLDEELSKEAPTAREFRSLQSEMEVRSQQWPGWREDLGLGQRGGTPGEFYNRYTGEPQGQPISFQRMMDDGDTPQPINLQVMMDDGDTETFRDTMDSDLGNGSSGTLGAQVEFRNVPEGVTTDADADGFDSFTVNKTRQLQSV